MEYIRSCYCHLYLTFLIDSNEIRSHANDYINQFLLNRHFLDNLQIHSDRTQITPSLESISSAGIRQPVLVDFAMKVIGHVAALFGSAVFVVINGILFAWMPWLFRNLGEWRDKYREIITVSVLFLGMLPIGGVIAHYVAGQFAPLIIGSKFDSAFHLIPWAIAGAVSMGYFYHNQAYLLYKKAILPMSLSSITCITLNVIFSYYGAIHYGMIGALAATIAAFLIAALISASFIIPKYNLKFANTRGSEGLTTKRL